MDKWEEMYNKAKKEYHREEHVPVGSCTQRTFQRYGHVGNWKRTEEERRRSALRHVVHDVLTPAHRLRPYNNSATVTQSTDKPGADCTQPRPSGKTGIRGTGGW